MLEHDKIYNNKLSVFNDVINTFKNNSIFPENVLKLIQKFAEPVKYVFTPLTSSTLSAQGMLKNVEFHEEDLIFALQPTGNIMKMECNYGISYNDKYKKPQTQTKKSNRGRKKKEKRKKNRKIQGNGLFFNSQMSFWVRSNIFTHKLYKVKVFRNGTLEIPGVLDPKMSDAWEVSKSVCDALNSCLLSDVYIIDIYSIMRNYKFQLIDDNVLVNLNKLKNKFIEAKNYDNRFSNLCQIKYNNERYPGLIIKFSTPTETNGTKKTTIKMFQSGKVNIDGAVSEEQALFYYNLLNSVYLQWESFVMYIPINESDYSSSSDDED